MKRYMSHFSIPSVIVGIVLGFMTVAFNESAYMKFEGSTVLIPKVLLGATAILSVIGLVSRPLTQSRLGMHLTSLVGGSMIGIMIVGTYYHWGQGVFCFVIPVATYMLRKAVSNK